MSALLQCQTLVESGGFSLGEIKEETDSSNDAQSIAK